MQVWREIFRFCMPFSSALWWRRWTEAHWCYGAKWFWRRSKHAAYTHVHVLLSSLSLQLYFVASKPQPKFYLETFRSVSWCKADWSQWPFRTGSCHLTQSRRCAGLQAASAVLHHFGLLTGLSEFSAGFLYLLQPSILCLVSNCANPTSYLILSYPSTQCAP